MQRRVAPITTIAGTWALCGVIHLLTFPLISLTAWEGLAYSLATIALLARPSSKSRFVAFLGATLVLLALHYVQLSNHLVLELWISLAILAILGFKIRQIKARTCSIGQLYAIIGPVVRIQYLLLYVFAALSKLNSDFLRPEVSCASLFANKVIESFNLPIPITDLTGLISIYLTLAAEIAIPVLLSLKRTRNIGVLVALIFHFTMGLIPILGISSFSALSFTILLFFLPEESFAHVDQVLKKLRETVPAFHVDPALRMPIIALILVALTLVQRHFLHPSPILANAVWLAIYAPLTWIVFNSMLKARTTPQDGGTRLFPRPAKYLVLATPVFVVGLLPYFGLQTQGSFTMFSNLRLLGDNPNHLLATSELRLSTPQFVRIIGTNHPELRSYPDSHFLIADHELRRKAARATGDFYILCDYQGEIQLIGRFQGELTEHPLLAPLPRNPQRFIRYRDVSTLDFCECTW
ncbi:HTTM domain-containing protein [Pelagicoccus sp. SDUM812002]|uniref:HTTM domain-containing protein n=1 Tax=Pelagicoccus sp. SDUM812002 TaxID=3041266 RepID=UPI00280C5D63|nr:HTTM domain-containing protein [Pelagicoccus sp. SDUM812002]MDQ8186039.1 HTTM domain-containing protein [Pelagicoccus sp. SDUM812002]